MFSLEIDKVCIVQLFYLISHAYISSAHKGPPYEFSLLESCHVNVSSGYIDVYCSYPNNSTATGFQVVAQMSNVSEVHKLYTGKSTDHQNSVNLRVGEDGIYQVSVFAIREGTGISDSTVEYTEQISVMDITGIVLL